MTKRTFKSWWIYLVRGVLVVLFGIAVLFSVSKGLESPDSALIGLSVYFGAMLFTIGVVNILGAIAQGGTRDEWYWMLSQGMLDIVIGLIIMIYPVLTGPTTLLVIGIWGLNSAIIQLTHALVNKEHLKNWQVTAISGGVLLVLAYLYLTGDLNRSALIIFYSVGAFMIVLGLVYIVLSFSVREMTAKKVHRLRDKSLDTLGELKGVPKSK